jgi:hypothetical protein
VTLHVRFALWLASDRWRARYSQRRLQGFGRRDAAALASGKPCGRAKVYDVPFWLAGRKIATVRVPAANRYGAEQFAERYLFASLYPHQTAEVPVPLPPGGRSIRLARSLSAQPAGETMNPPDISDDQIRALRDAAGTAGDLEQVTVCDRALAGSAAARRDCAKVIAYAKMRAEDDDISWP